MILSKFNLEGKVAIVTGAGRGLGHGIALGLAEAGADVVGVYSRTPGDTKELVEAMGRRYLGVQADLMDPAVAPYVIKQAVDAMGRVDILVNNAGIIRRGPAIEFSEKDWDDVMNVNLKSVFFLCQEAAKVMKVQGGGKIVNIASMLSYQGGINVSSYTASKSGMMGITRILANEFAPMNINVNAIAPGYMATDNTAPLRADKVRNRQILDRIPAGRWGNEDDLKGAVVFLASAAANYVNGFTLAVDGGWLSR